MPRINRYPIKISNSGIRYITIRFSQEIEAIDHIGLRHIIDDQHKFSSLTKDIQIINHLHGIRIRLRGIVIIPGILLSNP